MPFVSLLALVSLAPADTTLVLPGGVVMPVVRIEAGSFERPRDPDAPAAGGQRVMLTAPYWMGRTEVTWAQWRSVMEADDGRGRPRYPVRRVTWFDIQDFLARLSAVVDGWAFRLPTEAEWEYAARAGTDAPWASGPAPEALDAIAWTRVNAAGSVRAVGGLEPNAWGLHDMHGNVWEWVADWHAPYPEQERLVDPVGPRTGTERVRRGGSALYDRDAARSAHRYRQPPGRGNGNLGFRVVAEPTPRE